ncbi:MAG: hypothetical protein J6Y21_04715 [Clostridia bacterium]|nr:hypothetical protein [Clostridia bacterium]
MKKLTAILLCLAMVFLPLIGSAEEAQEAAGFETNLNWKGITYDGNTFQVRDDGLYTGDTSNTVFVRSDKYVDGTVSFTMEFDVDILSVVNNDYVWSEAWLYYTFSLGVPEEDDVIDEAVKNRLYLKGGVTIMPKTRDGVFIVGNSEMELPEGLDEVPIHLNVVIEYAASFEEIVYKVNGVELAVDYFSPEAHEGCIGIETAWTEMKVTKAIYTEYPDGLPSEQKTPTAEPTAETQPTEAPEHPTEEPKATEAAPTEQAATDKPADNTDPKDKTDDSSNKAWIWVVVGVAAAIVVVVIVALVLKKKKK